jgi:hypothetical protein
VAEVNETSDQLKALVISWTSPPLATGSSRIIHNLICSFGHDEIVLIGQRPTKGSAQMSDVTSHHRIFIPALPLTFKGERFLRFLFLPLIVAAGLYAIWRHKRRVLLVVFPDESYLLAGYILHLLTGLPLTIYFHDLYLENQDRFPFRQLARWLQSAVFSRASKMFVANPGMATHYQAAYGMESPTIVGYCINGEIPSQVDVAPFGNLLRVGFSGNVYMNVVDCLRTMKELVGGRTDLTFRYYTPAPQDQLERLGAWGENMSLEFMSSTAQLLRGLAACDVLYLPLCFDCDGIDSREIATAFPIKSMEYLIAGRPILVHCPANYYLAEFFRSHNAALVVDRPEKEMVLDALNKLRSDTELCRSLVGRALKAAQQFDGKLVAQELRAKLLEATVLKKTKLVGRTK